MRQKEEQRLSFLGRLDHKNTALLQVALYKYSDLIVVMKKRNNPNQVVTTVILHELLLFSSKEKYLAFAVELVLILWKDEYPLHFVVITLYSLQITFYILQNILQYLSRFLFLQMSQTENKDPLLGFLKCSLDILVRHSLQFLLSAKVGSSEVWIARWLQNFDDIVVTVKLWTFVSLTNGLQIR